MYRETVSSAGYLQKVKVASLSEGWRSRTDRHGLRRRLGEVLVATGSRLLTSETIVARSIERPA